MSKDGPFVFCMTGGEESVAARVQVVLNAFSTNTMHIGPLGSAMALKICNNLVSWCGIMLGIEVANVAEASGVPMDKLLTVMKRNGNLTPPMAGFVDFRNNPGMQPGVPSSPAKPASAKRTSRWLKNWRRAPMRHRRSPAIPRRCSRRRCLQSARARFYQNRPRI